MKRILIALSVSLLLGTAGAFTARAFMRPSQPILPDFDRRLEGQAARPGLAPEAIADLQSRVPEMRISVDGVLGRPQFFASRAGFLTGPGGVGLSVQPAFLQAFPASDPHRVIKAFLNEHASLLGCGAEILGEAVVTRDYVTPHNGLRTTVWQQHVDGIPVFGTVLMGHITKHEELVNLCTQVIPHPTRAADAGLVNRAALQAAPPVSAAQAVVHAARNIGEPDLAAKAITPLRSAEGAQKHTTLSTGPALMGETDARLVWFPLSSSKMRLCWQVILASPTRFEMFLVLVDAETGEVLFRRNQTRHLTDATYNIYPSDSPSPFTPGWPTPNTTQPLVVPRTLFTTAAMNPIASPLGWINDGDNITQGNNINAFSDQNSDGQPDQPRVTGNPFRVFDFPQDLTLDPTNYTDSSVVQLFYINNRFHDYLYGLGFTEAAGNFQMDNFGRGGLAGDPILATAQVGGLYNNAFMQTTPDGVPPRMFMLIFTGPNPRRDASLDDEVILHEHTHGVTERVLGGGVGVNYFGQSGAIHEGNSDWFAMTFLSEPGDDLGGVYPNGGYLTYDLIPGFRQNYYFGIRRYPYSTNMLKNPLTYKDIDPTQASPHPGIPVNPIFAGSPPEEVHNAGEVWCIVLWEMRVNLVAKHGWTNGNPMAMQLVLDGQRLSPPNPNFLQLRDAILQADLVNNAGMNHPEIWAAFAKRGMGGSATSPSSDTTVGIVEAYDVPGVAVVNAVVDDSVVGNNNGTIDYNECTDINILLRNGTRGAILGVTATLMTTNPLVTVVQPDSVYPLMPPGASAFNRTPFRIYTDPAFPCGAPIYFSLRITTPTDMRTNVFVMRTGYLGLNASHFENTTPVTIPDNNTNGVDSAVTVSRFPSPIGKVVVSLHVLHANADDLTLQLISPDGTKINLAKKRGGTGVNYGISCFPGGRTVFDDAARTPIDAAQAPFVGSFRPDEPLAAFSGLDSVAANGTWRLRAIDDQAPGAGSIQCWTLSLFPITCTDGRGQCTGDLALDVVATPEPVLLGSNLTYTLTVTSDWPAPALGVMVTNVLPTNATFVSAFASQGTVTNDNGVITFDFGAVNPGFPVLGTVEVTPSSLGTFTNLFVLSALTGDLDPANNVAEVVSTVVVPSPQLEAAGARLTAEGSVPPSHGIEPGETVTVDLALRNIGTAATTNLVATLRAANGVISPSGPQSYGVVGAFATQTVARPFTFTALGAPGSVVTAELQLTDGGTNLGTLFYEFMLSSSGIFANAGSIEINDAGPATPYPSTINVSGLTGVLSRISVTLSKFSHGFPDDVDVLLVSPAGQKVLLLSDAGGGDAVANRILTFDQAAAGTVPDNGPLVSGTYRPSNYESNDSFPLPAPGQPYSTSLDALRTIDPNGPWSLYVVDDTGIDAGTIVGGWSLDLTAVTPVNANANLAVAMMAAPDPVVVGSSLTYTITVTNHGPDMATGVMLTNPLPQGMTFVTASTSQGTVTNVNGRIMVALDAVPMRTNIVVTVIATPTAAGLRTSSASVTAAEVDLNVVNNTATVSTLVNSAAADLAVQVVDSPDPVVMGRTLTYTVSVTNRGPNAATSVRLTNTLPAGVLFGSASVSQGAWTNMGGRIIATLGDLPSGGNAVVTIAALPGAVGNLVDVAQVSSATADPALANNQATAATTVTTPAPMIVTAGSALVAESQSVNNAMEPGERVTLLLALRNSGSADTASLMATLQATGGVVLSDGAQAQSYGALLAEGPSVSRPFTFTASAAAGDTITVTLALQDGAVNLGTVNFVLPLSAQRTFANGGVILIPEVNAANPYPSTIAVSNITQVVDKVIVTLHRLSHTFVSDVDVLLVGPSGQKVRLMSDAGGDSGVTQVTLKFDDDAPASVPNSGALVSGTYKPTDYASGPADSFPAPAPAGPYSRTLSVLNGADPNGTWSLYVVDDTAGDDGRIDGGWSLSFLSTSPLPASADLAVTTTAAPEPAPIGGNVTLTVTAVNHGPWDVTGVVLTNSLPDGFYLTGFNTSQGTLSQAGNALICNVGILPTNAAFSLMVKGRLTTSGTATNVARVAGVEADANLANNVSVQTLTTRLPALEIKPSTGLVVLRWPNLAVGYQLEYTTSLNLPVTWTPHPELPSVDDDLNRVNVLTSTNTSMFFRLQKP